jgi:hypothetical protein
MTDQERIAQLEEALRAAWRENARYRALLTRARYGIDSWSTVDLDRLIDEIDAALATPDTTSAAIPQSEDGRRQRFLRSLEAVGADSALIDRVRAALAAPGADDQQERA